MVSAALPRGRKRQRRQLTSAAADRAHSGILSAVLPRVGTAPANLGAAPASDAAVRAKNRRLRSPEFMDSSDLDAQISTLALIRANGYGSVPGTPLLRRGVTAGSPSSAGGPRYRGSAHGVRSGATTGGAAATVHLGKGQRQSRSRDEGDSVRTNRDPWMGPLDASDVVTPTTSEPNTIERQELRRTKAQRLASVRGRCLLSQVNRVAHRRDLSTTAQLLASARAEFRSAGDANGASDVDETLIKIKADIVMETIQAARESRDYDRLQQLMVEALHYFAVLARHGQVNRHDTLGTSERRDANRRMYERLRQPLRLCREYALEDGRKSREAAAASARKRKYAEARAQLEDSRLCFNWAGNTAEELRELENVEREVKVRENTTCGDRLTESVASKLQFLTQKNYSGLFLKLSEAATAYAVAKDHDGAKVVRVVKAALNAVQSAERRWMQAVDALKERRYSSAAELLSNSKLFIADATNGLPFVSPSLARASKILHPPGGVLPLDIVAELAALDGMKDHTKSIRALEQGLLDKAQQLNTSAREVFEFIDCCFTMSSKSQGGGGNTSGGKSKVEVHSSAGDQRNDFSSPTSGENATGVAEGASSAAPGLALPDDELKEGEALLLKICRSTSAPTHVDNRTVKPRASATVHSGVRHRVEDILDEISETEDIITRNKALERGDKLMAAFWAAVAQSTATDPAAGGSTTSGATGATASKTNGDHTDDPSTNIARAGTNSTTGGDVNQRGWEAQHVPGPGGALSPETASRCLQLLADARDAYEGQGFSQQADGAGRLRAALLADRCLARAQALAQSAGATVTTASAATPATEGNIAGTPPVAGLQQPWLAQWAQGGGVVGACEHDRREGDLEAAKAAAREAEDNYSRAGNPAGALVARRTGMSLRGDEAMVSITPLLEKRAYDAVVEGLDQARRLYTDAGLQGLEGLCRTRDPLGLVKAAAMRDGKRLKAEAVRVLRDGDVEASRKLREQAQSCFSFVDHEGLADATADVYAAIHMVTRLSSGDAVVVAAEAALANGESDKAAELLREAKLFFHHAQLSYEDLVDQVTTLLEEHPNDLKVARKAMELQDNINRIYDSRRDGHRAVKVELCLDCLAADASLDNLAQVVDHEQFEDARTLLSAAAFVYERSTDQARSSKVNEISSLVGLVENASKAFEEGRYADAEGLVAEGSVTRAALAIKQPLCLRPPDCALFRGGEDGAKTAVLLRVRAAGEADRASALELLEAGDFEAAERAAASACKRFEWWADHHPDTGGDDGAAGHEQRCVEREQRQAVIGSAKELMASVDATASKARAERLKSEGRELKSMGKYVAAVKTLRSAAELFHAAGLAPAAVETRAEASRTQAEALLLTSAELHSEGKFEAIAEHLQSAESLLLEAAAETARSPAAATATTTAASGEQSKSEAAPIGRGDGDKIVIDDAAVKLDGSNRSLGDTYADDTHAPSEQENDGRGAEARCRILDDIVNLRSRVAGDIVMGGVPPALDSRDYDQGLLLMLEADRHYTAVKTGRWMTSVAAAFRKDSPLSSTSSPKELVMKRAAQDGDRLRGEAAFAIQKEKNPIKARELLSGAEACMDWAGVDPFAAGAVAVSKDIRIFESRAKGDEICKELGGRLQDKDFERAKGMLEEALTSYRQGDAFKQIADTQAVAFCVERESELCNGVNAALNASDPVAALKMLEDARPVFQIAAELRSAVLREAAELITVKHRHMTILSTFCRAWNQCATGILPASGDEGDVPDSAAVLDVALSDLRALIASEASVLDVSFDLLQDARERVCAKVVTSPAIPLPVDVGVADPDVVTSEDGETLVSDARSAEEVHAEGEVSDLTDGGQPQPAPPIEDHLVGKEMSRDMNGLDEVENEDVPGGGGSINAVPQNEGSGPALPQEAGGEFNEENMNKTRSANEEDINATRSQVIMRQDEALQVSSAEKINLGDDITETSMAAVNQADDSYPGDVEPVLSSRSSATSAEHPPSQDLPLAGLSSLEGSDPSSLSSSTKEGRSTPANQGKNQGTSRDDCAESQHLGVDFEAADGEGGGNRSAEDTVGDAASIPDTAHAVRHTNETNEGSTGKDFVSITDGGAKEDGESFVGGRESFTSISTKPSDQTASTNSVGPEAAAGGSQGRGVCDHQTDPPPDAGRNDDGVISGAYPRDGTTDAMLTETESLIVGDSNPRNCHPLSGDDQKRGLTTVGPTNDSVSAQGHLDEEADAEVAPSHDDADISYDLDSDFGDDSADADSPVECPVKTSAEALGPTKAGIAETARIGEGDNGQGHCGGANEGKTAATPPITAVPSKGTDGELEEEHAATDDESDYPADIDKVDDHDISDDHSLSSGSTVGVSDSSSSVSFSEGNDSSSQSSADKSNGARGTSSGSSGGRLSDTYSAQGEGSVHGDSTASVEIQSRTNAVGGPRSSGGKVTDASNQDDDGDNDGYSLGDSSTADSAHSKQYSTAAADQNAEDIEDDISVSVEDSKTLALGGDKASPVGPPDPIEPDVMDPPQRFVEETEMGDRHEALSSDFLEDGTGNTPKALAEVDAAKSSAMPHETTPQVSEMAEPEAAEKDEIYKPNLGEIDTSVDIGDLKRQFGAMLTSSFSQPPEEPHRVGSDHSSAPPGNATIYAENEGQAGCHPHVPDGEVSGTDCHVLDKDGRKNGDDVYSSFGDDGWNDHNGALSSNNHEVTGACEDKDGGHHYTQEEWDQYNAVHGGYHGDVAPGPPNTDVAHEELAGSIANPHSYHEVSSDTWPASETVPGEGVRGHEFHDEGGGVGQVAGIPSSGVPPPRTNDNGNVDVSVGGASGEAIERTLHQEKELAASSSVAPEYAAVKKENGDDINDVVVGQQWKEPQQEEVEQPDDLYDIEGLGLSSSDSD